MPVENTIAPAASTDRSRSAPNAAGRKKRPVRAMKHPTPINQLPIFKVMGIFPGRKSDRAFLREFQPALSANFQRIFSLAAGQVKFQMTEVCRDAGNLWRNR